jgi:hypothetical protein
LDGDVDACLGLEALLDGLEELLLARLGDDGDALDDDDIVEALVELDRVFLFNIGEVDVGIVDDVELIDAVCDVLDARHAASVLGLEKETGLGRTLQRVILRFYQRHPRLQSDKMWLCRPKCSVSALAECAGQPMMTGEEMVYTTFL